MSVPQLFQSDTPRASLADHRNPAYPIRAGDPESMAAAMHAHVAKVFDVVVLHLA